MPPSLDTMLLCSSQAHLAQVREEVADAVAPQLRHQGACVVAATRAGCTLLPCLLSWRLSAAASLLAPAKKPWHKTKHEAISISNKNWKKTKANGRGQNLENTYKKKLSQQES